MPVSTLSFLGNNDDDDDDDDAAADDEDNVACLTLQCLITEGKGG